MKKIPIAPPRQVEKMTVAFPHTNVVHTIFPHVGKDFVKWFLLVSDRHFDSVDTNRELQMEHLEMAKERDAHVLEFGDTFDAMQGKWDPRRSYDSLRPEYKSDKYLDLIVKDAVEKLTPYADRFLVFGRGNHESALKKNNNVDLISNLVYGLNVAAGTKIQAGGYGGWVKFTFKIGGTQSVSVNLKYFHGAGGGGPVTRGVIQTNRQAVYLPDADIIVNGHTHDSWYVPIQRERLSAQGEIFQDTQHHIRIPSYKDEYKDGYDGFHVETWKPPKPIGAVWLKFSFHTIGERRSSIRVEPTLDIY